MTGNRLSSTCILGKLIQRSHVYPPAGYHSFVTIRTSENARSDYGACLVSSSLALQETHLSNSAYSPGNVPRNVERLR